MRSSKLGWRSLRSAMALDGIASAPVQPRTPTRTTPAVAQAPVVTATTEPPPPVKPWAKVPWTLTYICFLLYIFAITTYAAPIATAVMIVALLGLPFVSGGFRVPGFFVWMTFFLIWATLGYLNTQYPEASWLSLETLFKLWLVALVAANAVRTAAHLRFFTIFFLWCFAFWPVRGALFNYYIYGQTWMGRAIWQFAYGNPNDLAAFCLFQVGLAACVLVHETNHWVRRAAIAGLLVLPVLIFYTQSRGALLGLGYFAATALIGHRKELARAFGRKYQRRLIVGVSILVAAVVIFSPEKVWERIKGMSKLTSTSTIAEADTEGSAAQRWAIWKVARRIAADHPVFGTGIGSYPHVHGDYVQFEVRSFLARGRRDAHSTYLLVLAETGILGFTFFVGMIGSVLMFVHKVRKRARHRLPRGTLQLYYLQNGLIAFLVAGLFGSFQYLHLLYIYMAILWAWAMMVQTRLREVEGGVQAAEPLRRVRGGWSAAPQES